MNLHSPPIQWIPASVARQRLGLKGRALFQSELEAGRLGLRFVRIGKRGETMVAEVDVERAVQRLARGEFAA
jgi:hypothetical protein